MNINAKIKDCNFTIIENINIAPNVYKMKLMGDGADAILRPGQFINIALAGKYLRRPISVCDKNNGTLTIIYKVVGAGTMQMSKMKPGNSVKALAGLGNGFDIALAGSNPLIIGGGVGVPPLYMLAKNLTSNSILPKVILGFNTSDELILVDDFVELGCDVSVTTVDGSFGIKGFVTDDLPWLQDNCKTTKKNTCSYMYTCGPEPMLRAVYNASKIPSGNIIPGQYSFESRMGCGFGACMGCSCKTITGYKRICVDGPVLHREEILWQN